MATILKKRDGESDDQLQVRFNRKCTRFVKGARNSRYLEKKPSMLKKKRIAVIREKYRAENERKKYYE